MGTSQLVLAYVQVSHALEAAPRLRQGSCHIHLCFCQGMFYERFTEAGKEMNKLQ